MTLPVDPGEHDLPVEGEIARGAGQEEAAGASPASGAVPSQGAAAPPASSGGGRRGKKGSATHASASMEEAGSHRHRESNAAHGAADGAVATGERSPAGRVTVEALTGELEPVNEKVQGELAELKDKYLRLAAEFENFRRRKAQELEDSRRYASQEAVLAILPALDNLLRALDSAAGTDEPLLEGVRMVVRQMETALEALGLTPVPGVGAPFDPSLHEALMGEEGDDMVKVDTVVAEMQRGYRLHDRLLRPALVKVAHPVALAAGSEQRREDGND